MRALLQLIAAVLAVGSIFVVAFVPFVTFEWNDAIESDEESSSSWKEANDDWEAGNGVFGANPAWVLASTVMLAVFAIANWVLTFWNIKGANWVAVGTGFFAIFPLQATGFWTGANMVSLHNLMAGYDPQYNVWTFGPLIASFMVMAVLVLTWLPLGKAVRTVWYSRTAIAAGGVLLLGLMMPWSAVEMGDIYADMGIDEDSKDTFHIAASQIMLGHDANENVWEVTSMLLLLFQLALIGVVAAATVAFVGEQFTHQDPLLARTLEHGIYAGALLGLFALVMAFVAGGIWYEPVDDKSTIVAEGFTFSAYTLLPMITAVVPVGLAILGARTIPAKETRLVADDFPEPVIYE